MRATLFAVGAFLFLAYPLVLLFAIARNIDQPREKPTTAAMTFTSGSAKDLLEHDSPGRTYGGLRNTTLRKSGH